MVYMSKDVLREWDNIYQKILLLIIMIKWSKDTHLKVLIVFVMDLKNWQKMKLNVILNSWYKVYSF